MTDAPERIFAHPHDDEGWTRIGRWNVEFAWHDDEIEYVRADVSRAAVEAAYIAGLEAAAKAADCGCEVGECVAKEFGTPMCYRDGAAEVETLKDPALVRDAVAKLTEGRGDPYTRGNRNPHRRARDEEPDRNTAAFIHGRILHRPRPMAILGVLGRYVLAADR
jgi:hypothetical protein